MVVKRIFLFPLPLWLSLSISISISFPLFFFPIPSSFSSLTPREGSIAYCGSFLHLSSSSIPPSSPSPMQLVSRCASSTSLIPPPICIIPSSYQVVSTWSMCLSIQVLILSTLLSAAGFVLHLLSPLPCFPSIPPSVLPVSDISSTWLVFTPSHLHFPRQKSTVSVCVLSERVTTAQIDTVYWLIHPIMAFISLPCRKY